MNQTQASTCGADGSLLDQETTSTPLWFEPSERSLVEAMTQVRIDWVERERRARAGRDLMASHYSEQVVNRIVRKFLSDLNLHDQA
jgi:hypothetical protein